jgi:hypothetical protein
LKSKVSQIFPNFVNSTFSATDGQPRDKDHQAGPCAPDMKCACATLPNLEIQILSNFPNFVNVAQKVGLTKMEDLRFHG